MKVKVTLNSTELGQEAAKHAAEVIREAIANKGKARIILSTGASQFEFLKAFVQQEIDWSKVEMFHLDEYVGLTMNHKASFRKYLQERFIDALPVPPAGVFFVDGEGDIVRNIKWLTEKIRKAPIDLALVGIGVNGHIAFNNPPADFQTREAFAVVNLNEDCKKQQVGEGWFARIMDVPKQAVSMTVHQILQSEAIISCVPHKVKANAVLAILENGITPLLPASILKTHPNWTLYIEEESASLLDSGLLHKVNYDYQADVYPFPYDVKDQLKQQVYRRSMEAFDAGDQARDEVQNPGRLEERRKFIHEKLLEGLGGLPSYGTPLCPEITGTVAMNGYRIEKIIFQSRPMTYVTSNLYIPDGITAPRGAVLFLCGHHNEAKSCNEYQAVLQKLVLPGLIVFAVDPLGQGERSSYFQSGASQPVIDYGIYEHDYAGTQSWLIGDGIARYFIHDAMRALDYLCTRPEVDSKRIGVTGNSGGGTQTSLMMLCDPRIAAAAPATFIMNRRTYLTTGMAQDAEQIWPGMSSIGFDHEDILMAMAPRPVLVLAVTHDFFPIEDTRITMERSRRFWDMYGKFGDLEYFEDVSVHRYTDALAIAAADFFAKHLLGALPAATSQKMGILEQSALWCTPFGQVRGQYPNSMAVYEENQDRLSKLENNHAILADDMRKETALSWLRIKVYADRKICDPFLRLAGSWQMDQATVQSALWRSQKEIMNYGVLFRHFQNQGKKLPLTIAIWDGGTLGITPHIGWIRAENAKGRAVLVLDLTGIGALSPNGISAADIKVTFGTLHKLTTDLYWLNDSLAAIRVFDVLRILDLVEMFPDIDSSDIEIYTEGRSNLYAQLACVLNSRVRKFKAVNGIESMAALVKSRLYDDYDISGIIMPGMLKYFDLPDLLRWAKL